MPGRRHAAGRRSDRARGGRCDHRPSVAQGLDADIAGAERYALITDACVSHLGLETEALRADQSAETFDYLGEVQIWLRDISAAFVDGDGVRDWVAPRRRPLLEVELRAAGADALWERLTSPENRARVAFCAADRLAQVEEIVEWRPFASFTRRVKLQSCPAIAA